MTSQIKTVLLLGLLSGIIIAMGGLLGGRTGVVFAFGLALLMNVGSYWYSDKIVLSMYRARELAPEEAPALHSMVEELARNAGIPKPRICVVPEAAPNAFATGRTPEHAVVAVTEGIACSRQRNCAGCWGTKWGTSKTATSSSRPLPGSWLRPLSPWPIFFSSRPFSAAIVKEKAAPIRWRP